MTNKPYRCSRKPVKAEKRKVARVSASPFNGDAVSSVIRRKQSSCSSKAVIVAHSLDVRDSVRSTNKALEFRQICHVQLRCSRKRALVAINPGVRSWGSCSHRVTESRSTKHAR